MCLSPNLPDERRNGFVKMAALINENKLKSSRKVRKYKLLERKKNNNNY